MSTRHRVRHRNLGRGSDHSKAIMRSLVCELITHERIITTEAKARALRPIAEKMVTKAKRGLAVDGNRVHAYRLLMARLGHNRSVVEKLFARLAPRYQTRPGGYTRMIKLGPRKVDAADMAVIEFVDASLGPDVA